MPASPQQVEALRRRLARMEGRRPLDARHFSLGHTAADQALDGLRANALHEVYPAASGDMASADGFALGLALRASEGRFIVWVIQSMSATEAGLPYGEGIRAWGVDPGKVLLVRTPDTASLLAASEEALKCGAVGAVMMSAWGETRAMTLTAGRRLALAAQGGATAILVRAGAEPQPSAAETRWIVAAAPSRPLEADAPGRPSLNVRLARSRAGGQPRNWIMEWDGETRGFVQPASVPRGLVPLAAERAAEAMGPGGGHRRTG